MTDPARPPAASSVPSSEDPLAFLVAPMPTDRFFADFHERAPLLCGAQTQDRFALLLTHAQLDAYLDTADLREGSVNLVRDGMMISRDRFVGASGRIIPSAVAEEHLNGATIIFQQLQDAFQRLGALCRGLEATFSARVQANVYLTPAGGHGFAPHADAHDVFVLQVAGEKQWRLHGRGEGTLTLRPGDSLYVPRGLVHEAWSTGDQPSLHITIGIIASNWADLLAAALAELSEQEPNLHKPLPAGHAREEFDRTAIRQRLAGLAGRLAGDDMADAALDRLIAEWLRDRRPQVGGVLAGSGRQGARRYRARPLVPWRLQSHGHDVVLIGPGGDLRFDRNEEAALRKALSGHIFSPADLPMRDAERLVRRLLANGYVEAAPEI